MAFGVNRARSAEQDRQRAIGRAQAQEESADSDSPTPEQAPGPEQRSQVSNPAPARAPGSFRPGVSNRPSTGNSVQRVGGSFRPGGNSRPMSREQDEARFTPSTSAAVEDGVSSVQVVRRLLEIAAVRKWPQDRVTRLELMAHDDAAAVWSKLANEWERLCEDRRAMAAGRNTDQVSFRIISGDIARESRPTGPRARSMALLHGMDLVRLPVQRSPFSAETVAEVSAQQRKMRQEASGAQGSEASAPSTPSPAEQPADQAEQAVETPRPNRFVRTTRP